MESSLYKASAEVFKLLPSLHEEVPACRGKLDRDAFSGVACPDIQARVTRATVDSQEVEVRVESGEDGILLAILDQIGSGGGKQMGAVGANVRLGCLGSQSDVTPTHIYRLL